MDNLLQIKDLIPIKEKTKSSDAKADKWLKSITSNEKNFKNFSQALNEKTHLKDNDLDQSKEAFNRKENLSETVEEDKMPTLYQENILTFSEENIEKGTENLLEYLTSFNDKELDNKVVVNEFPLKQDLPKEFHKEAIVFSEEIVSQETVLSCDDKIPEMVLENAAPQEKKNGSEISDIPLVVETRPILHEEENFSINENSNEDNENEEVAIEANGDLLKLGKKNTNNSVSIVSKPSKELMIGNTYYFSQDNPAGFDKFVQTKNLDFLRNIGINSASYKDKEKEGIVSVKQVNSFKVENCQKHTTFEDSRSQELGTPLSENLEHSFSSSRQDSLGIRQEESLVTPRTVVQKYDEIRQNYADSVSGVIAAISDQMDELKRVRRNALNVKVDLENGESLNCQLVVSKDNLDVRFSAIADGLKTQILNHWEQLKRFAEMRNFNLSNPYFIKE